MKQDFVISQTPVPRMISLECQKVLGVDSVRVKSCQKCLKLVPCGWWERENVEFYDDVIDENQEVVEPPLKVGSLEVKEEIEPKVEQKTLNPHQTKNNKKRQIALDMEEETKPMKSREKPPSSLKRNENLQVSVPGSSTNDSYSLGRINEEKFACESEGCDFLTWEIPMLKKHCTRYSHHSSILDDEKPKTWSRKRKNEGRFHCESCDFKTDYKRNLKPHVQVQHKGMQVSNLVSSTNDSSMGMLPGLNPGPFPATKSGREVGPLDVECESCGSVMTCSTYPVHMKKTHGVTTQTWLRQCFWCDMSLSMLTLQRHARFYHFWGKFSCKESHCNFKGDFATELVEHINCVHKGEVDAKCPECKKGWSVNEIENHYKECVTKRFREERRKLNTANACCETCGKFFKNRKGYREHKRKHLREQAAAKGDKDEGNLYYHCDKCSKRFTSRYGLRQHFTQEHDESSKFPCPTCGVVFDIKRKLNAHERAVHSTDERYQCKHCRRRFGNLNVLKIHELSHHGPRFQCKFCPRKLKTEKNLISHERYHTGEKPFTCSICGNGYVNKERLSQHQTGAHKIPGTRGGKPGWNRSKK